jgi:hypothetical protein
MSETLAELEQRLDGGIAVKIAEPLGLSRPKVVRNCRRR